MYSSKMAPIGENKSQIVSSVACKVASHLTAWPNHSNHVYIGKEENFHIQDRAQQQGVINHFFLQHYSALVPQRYTKKIPLQSLHKQ